MPWPRSRYGEAGARWMRASERGTTMDWALAKGAVPKKVPPATRTLSQSGPTPHL
jgi:hypothetical protein